MRCARSSREPVSDVLETAALEEPGLAGWGAGSQRRFAAVAGARLVAQVGGLAWFVIAARLLDPTQFGLLATGMTFFAVFAGLGDLGVTRTLTRHVAADPRSIWAGYVRGGLLRLFGGLVSAAAVVAVLALFQASASLLVVALAGLVAAASGLTEVAFTALRSVGRVRTEATLLVGERIVFLGVGAWALVAGAGAVGVLGVYLATNIVSAVIAGLIVWRVAPAEGSKCGSFWDGEARLTAGEFALATVSPRTSAVLLTLMATPVAVGTFVAAQRPVEALALLALSASSTILPIVRSRLVAGQRAEALRASNGTLGAIVVALTPVLVFFIVQPTVALDLLFGSDRVPGGEPVLQLLAVTGLTWAFRGVAEALLLAEERAGAFFGLIAAGLAVNIVLGVPLVATHGATGAAIALLIAELVMTAALTRLTPGLVSLEALKGHLPAIGFGALTAILLLVVPGSIGAVAVTVAISLPAAWIAWVHLRRLEPQS